MSGATSSMTRVISPIVAPPSLTLESARLTWKRRTPISSAARVASRARSAGMPATSPPVSTSTDTSWPCATIGEITRVIEEVAPDTIYTHSGQDLNQDHRNVHHATAVAARRVPRLFCYQSASSTVEFRPTRFVPVDEFMDRKLAVIRSYTSQVKTRRYLDAELLRATSRYWSRYGHSRFVEPFEVARDAEGEAKVGGAADASLGAMLENV